MNFLKRLAAAAAGVCVAVAGFAVEAFHAPVLLGGLVTAAGLSMCLESGAPMAAYAYAVASPYILADRLFGYAKTGNWEKGMIERRIEERFRDKEQPAENIVPGRRPG